MKFYKTNWTITERTNIDKTLYDILSTAIKRTRYFRNKQLFFSYFTLLYLGGKRRIEPFLYPVTISKIQHVGLTFYRIHSAVAKHFENKMKKCKICGEIFYSKKGIKEHIAKTGHNSFSFVGSRKLVSHIFRAENEYEKALFEFLLNGRETMRWDFTPLLPPRYRNTQDLLEKECEKSVYAGITKRFKMFKAEITNGKIVEKDSLVPHMLRHMRAYDLWIIHKYNPFLVQRLLNWDKTDMLYYYTDIKNTIQELEELNEYLTMVK
jgi:hypothetical protein